MPIAKSRKNGRYGYKAIMIREDGSTRVCHPKNFETAEQAVTQAERYIRANYSDNPDGEKTGGPNAVNGLSPERARTFGR